MRSVPRIVRCATALVAVALLASCADGDATGTTSTSTSVVDTVTTLPPVTDPPPATVVGDSMVDRLYGTVIGRWVVVGSSTTASGGPPQNPLPWFELQPPRLVDGSAYEVSLLGSDGCNWLGVDALVDDDGALADVRAESTAVLCDPPGAEIFADGTRLTWLASDRLQFTTTAGQWYTFAPLDAFGDPAAAPADVLGEWLVVFSPRLSLSLGDGWLTLGGCQATWAIFSGVVQVDWEGDRSSCIGVGQSATELNLTAVAARLVEALDDPGLVVRRSGDDLLLSASQLSFALTRAGDPLDPDALSLADGSAFGLRPGDAVDVDREVARVSAALGTDPTLDTDWYPVPDETPADGTEDCIGGPDYRVVWWGDLRLAFWRDPEGNFGPALWNWSVGDRNVMWFGKSEPGAQPDAPPSGLASGLGFSVGDAASTLDPSVVVPTGITDDGLENYTVIGPGSAMVGVRDGVIVGFGSQLLFC